MFAASMPIRHEEVAGQYMFSHNGECVALGEYCDAGFLLMEDKDYDLFPSAMVAFTYLSTRYRLRQTNQYKQSIEN